MSGKYFEIDYGVRSKLAQFLYLQKKHRYFCDLKVNIGSVVSVYLHSCVLAAFSPCLDSLLLTIRNDHGENFPEISKENLPWSFKQPLEITVCFDGKDTSQLECEQCAVQFFDFLYIGKMRIAMDHVHHVEYLSNLLQVKDLLEVCNTCRERVEPSNLLFTNNVALSELEARRTRGKVHDYSNELREQVQPWGTTGHSTHLLKTLMTCEKSKETHETKVVLKHKGKVETFPVFSQFLKEQIKDRNPCESLVSNQLLSANNSKLKVVVCQLKGQKTISNKSIQPESLSECEKKQAKTTVEKKEVPCGEELIKILEENIPSPEEKQDRTCGEFSTEILSSHEMLPSIKSVSINKSNEIKIKSKICNSGDYSIKPVTSRNILTQFDNILDKRKGVYDSFENSSSEILENKETTKGSESESFLNDKELGPLINEEVLFNKEKTGYQCICCDYFAKNHYDLLTHMLLSNHTKKICSLCLVDTKSWKTLSEHILQHNDPLPFFCRHCSMRFETFSELNRHTSKHTGMIPCYCPICFVLFNSKFDLQKHMFEHKEGEIYVCRQCYFSTADKSKFNSHSSVLTDSDFECLEPNCSFKTDLVCILKDHSVHHSYKCVTSHSSFSNEDIEKCSVEHEDSAQVFKHPDTKCSFKTNFESRSIIDLSFLCNTCGNTFPSLEDLQQHVLQHLSCESMISCPICPFKGNTCVNFREHILKCHPQYKCEIVKIMNTSAIQNSLISALNKSDILMKSEKHIESVSDSTNVEEYDEAKVGMNTKTFQPEKIISCDSDSGNYNCSNFFENNLINQRASNSSSPFERKITNVHKENTSSLILNRDSVANLKFEGVSIYKTTEYGSQKTFPCCSEESFPIKKQKIDLSSK